MIVTGSVQNTAASFQRPGDPLLDDVDLSELAIGEADVVEAPGWLPLVKAGDVPLILLGEVGGRRAVYFTFDLTQSNLPVQVAFPVLGSRLLAWLAGGEGSAMDSEPAGIPIPLTPPDGWTATVTLPSGEVRTPPGDAVLFDDTRVPGVYRVDYQAVDGTSRPGPIAVRHFVAAESAGMSRRIEMTPITVGGGESTSLVREWAPILLMILLALLLLEWWIGHGSPRPGRRRPMRQPVAGRRP